MKKGDLKTGMIVECRSGDSYIVMLDHYSGASRLFNLNMNGFMSLNLYTCDLKMEDIIDKSWDIIKIFTPRDKTNFTNSDNVDLLWSREKTPEYTMEELIKIVGKDFKIKK